MTASEAESKVTGDAVKVNGRRDMVCPIPTTIDTAIARYFCGSNFVRAQEDAQVYKRRCELIRNKTPCQVSVANAMAVAPR